jgi:rare lipoprotein A (peptidoglycan hydrolase)
MMGNGKWGVAALSMIIFLSGAPSCSGKSTNSDGHPPSWAAAVATHVAKRAHRLEKQEGNHNVVKDRIRITTMATGQTRIEQGGEASVYGRRFQGKRMASKKRFNPHALTAAHPTLPLGTTAKVTNLETGKAVHVRIIDRGPYAKGRDIDLSPRAAQVIGLTRREGEAPVKIEATLPRSKAPLVALAKRSK